MSGDFKKANGKENGSKKIENTKGIWVYVVVIGIEISKNWWALFGGAP